MRIGHLVEHQHQRTVGQRRQAPHGQGLGLDHDALMDRVGTEDLVNVLRRNDLDRKAAFEQVFDLEPDHGVLRQEHLDDLPLGIVESGAHRVQAVELNLVGRQLRSRPVLRAGPAPLVRLGRRNLAAFTLGVAVGASQGGVMGVFGALVAGFILAHAAL